MKKTLVSLSIIALVFLLTASTVSAEGRGVENRGMVRGGERAEVKVSVNGTGRGIDKEERPIGRPIMASSTYGFNGVVQSVGVGSFTITSGMGMGMGYENRSDRADERAQNQNRIATTTYTVTVNSSTTYNTGTSTVSAFSDLAVNKHVIVMGTLATSTKTITATRVNIVDPNVAGQMMRAGRNGVDFSSSTAHQVKPGFFRSIGNWFKKIF